MLLPEGLRFEVCWLILQSGICPTWETLEELKQLDMAFFASSVDVLRKLQTAEYHRKPITRKLEGGKGTNFYEARVMGGKNRQLARFPFVYRPNAVVIILYGFTKDYGDSSSNLIKQASKYNNELVAGRGTYEKIKFPN